MVKIKISFLGYEPRALRLRFRHRCHDSSDLPRTISLTVPEHIVVGLSGGVDSAVAALILKRQGMNVSGIFMKNWDEDDGTEYCTAQADYEDALRIAEVIDIELHPINFSAEYWDLVFEDFLIEYKNGRTPNPDILCNQHIKFDVFIEYARSLGASAIASGHYAEGTTCEKGFALFRARDTAKDQTYFLQAVPRAKLEFCMFPLAKVLKTEVRDIAKQNNLHVFDKKDSTGICFIGERRFDDFLSRFVPKHPGPVVTGEGEVIGEHDGLAFYTIGQRSGLGIGGRRDSLELPWYVVSKELDTNELVVSQETSDLMARRLSASSANWLVDNPHEYSQCTAVVRHRARPKRCVMEIDDRHSSVDVNFDEPQRAITPGQFVAFYSGARCLGGAKIQSVDL